MASTLKHLRSSTADKRPTASGLVDGQLAINTASGTPALFFKDSNGGVVKVGPAHVGSAAPNAVPAGSAGNSLGELWVDNSLTTPGLKYYTGSAFINLTPSGTETVVGLVELATPAETQAGTDAIRAVTPSGLQSKVSDSTSTTSSTTIASSTAVKAAYDLANAALPKAGGTVTGELLIGTTGSLVFEGSTDDSFETTLAVIDPTADRTITFPNVTGTVVTTGDSGTVTSTMIANDTIVNADINSAAAIAYSKLATMTAGNILLGNASNVATSTAVTGDVTISDAGVTAIASGAIVNADVNTSAAIAGTKIAPDFGSQNITTTGTLSATSVTASGTNPFQAGSGAVGAPSYAFSTDLNSGFWNPAGDTIAVAISGVEAARFDTSRRFLIGNSTARANFYNSTFTTPLQIEGSGTTAAGSWGSLALIHNATADANGPFMVFARTGGSAIGSNTIVTDNDRCGQIDFQGSDGAQFVSAARIVAEIDGAPAADVMPGALIFSVNTGGTSLDEVMRISSFGEVGIGTNNPTSKLHIDTYNNPAILLTDNFTDPSTYLEIGLNAGSPSILTLQTLQVKSYVTNFWAAGVLTASVVPGGFCVGEEESLRDGFHNSATTSASFQVEGTSNTTASMAIVAGIVANALAPNLIFAKSAGISKNDTTLVPINHNIGRISFQGADFTDFVNGAEIRADVDGTSGDNDMPGRLVFSTTSDGAASSTERMRITREGVIGYHQVTPAAVNTSATITIANMKTGIITSTTAAAVTMTLPTGTNAEAGFNSLYTNFAFEWSIINTGATNSVTVAGNTGHTIVGSAIVTAANSGRFVSRRTAANTFVSYRLA